MKKLCYSAFIAFWSSIATILGMHALANDGEEIVPAETTYTLEQVAEHNTLEDCWMAIEGRVYDITAYVDRHPTQPSVLEPWCGNEATEGMRTKGFGRDHSDVAWNLLESFQVGLLSE